ncbi:MAG TPA: M14 metallopeptidase family protein [Pyrinomonadaceae bacterium]|nr:M14 metallopeptidase family protein [Pyrinomonadaceae bacterium]
MNKNLISAPLRLCGLLLLLSFAAFAQKVPAPVDVLSFTPGDNRKLASWMQVVEYFKKLDAASDRMQFQEIGKSTMGAPFVYAAISTPANLKNLEKYKEINKKLADPRLIKSNDKTAQALIKQGKTIVLITCGIHSTEVGSTLSSMLIAHRLASSNEPEIQKILDNTIILLVPSLNPDGVDIVKNWYDKTLGTPFEGTSPPELYHKYVGHDNNRDWYAFTQVETQLTVDKIHNVWHPQIVHDIHQQGERGARLFLPPYEPPVEPNVPKELVEGFTELGNFMANDLRKKGFQGITTGTSYDAWTPARAYSHYHGGVRILSETASARIATPIEIKFDDLRGGRSLDVKTESENFGPVWKGGEWKLGDITNYMTTAAFSLLKHAAEKREKWLSRFYAIGKEAVRPRKESELFAFILPVAKAPNSEDLDSIQGFKSGDDFRRERLLAILRRGGVEVDEPNAFQVDGVKYPRGTAVIKLAQPYGNFAKTLLEKQTYPNLKDEKGNPIAPYDVTAHTLPLLMNVEVKPVYKVFKSGGGSSIDGGNGCGCAPEPIYKIYKSSIPNMDEGWTRWIVEGEDYQPCCGKFESIVDKEIRKEIGSAIEAIIFPDQSPNQILNGYAKGTMPDEYTGGVGKEGVENLKKFVEAGGTLVFLNRASNFAIEQFNLPVKDITQGVNRRDFYIPGSILRTELDTTHPIAKGMPEKSIAWFENSPAFEIQTDPLALTKNFRIIASYPKNSNDILLSGWALGTERLAGKAALVEFTIGKGKIVLFGFRPQYRGQSLATFPLLFNAIAN